MRWRNESGRREVISLLGMFLLSVSVASADVVHLDNGRSLEGVIVEESATRVLLQLPFGEIGLPRSTIARIERGQSALGEYLDRRQELRRRPGTATDWLELARWAAGQQLDHSFREAVLVAARLDPGLPALAPAMRELGFEYEVNAGVWVTQEEYMSRRGYVLYQGRWLSSDQMAQMRSQQRAEELAVAERQRQDRLARAVEALMLAQVAREEEERRLREQVAPVQHGIPLWWGYPIVVPPPVHYPKPPLPTHPHRRAGSGRHDRGHGSYPGDLVHRPPGSWIPVEPAPRSHRGTFQTPPDR